ncbi:MAG: cytochrome-c peroxidase [Gammaproteobacteria bacterium]|nr:cytochrome-c peroxidase [Gammaproteobacteria bacterium]MBQ0839207.1 cytochrome-c peroxidase [Gammaproteobacteria bacterium]
MIFKMIFSAALLLSATVLQVQAQAPQQAMNRLPSAVGDADYYDHGAPSDEKVSLGALLFWDKILSGNKNIACASCHHSLTDTGDGLSLPVGEGGRGLGMARDTGVGADGIHERVPRNAPPLWNLGARSMAFMFHDGRISADAAQPSGFLSPAGDDLPVGLDNPLAVQAMFPVTSAAEMAGQAGENSIANAVANDNLAGPGGVWTQLAERLQGIPQYVDLFVNAFDDVSEAADITYVHAANAIAAYQASAFRADNSPFDKFLRGDGRAMSPMAKRGMRLFYGQAQCSSCHSGQFQTDMGFHAIAMPQIGNGKGNGLNGRDDFGRFNVSADMADKYRFRTPPLRNVALTGPWGHDGAYNTLGGVVEHHLNAQAALDNYATEQAILPPRDDLDALDFEIYNDDESRAALAAASEIEPVRLSERSLEDLMAFLYALSDRDSADIRYTTPISVPSGLPLAD